MDTSSVVLSGAAYWLAFVLVALGPGKNSVSAFNLPRNFNNCSGCHRALGKDIDQLRRLTRIRNRIEDALGTGRVESPGQVQSDGPPKPRVPLPPEEEEEEIISFPAKIDRRDESSLLEFVIDARTADKDVEVVSANLWIRVKKRGRSRKGKRIVLKVFQQELEKNKLITYLRTKVKKTRWQKLSLPISSIQKLVKPHVIPSKLQLRIDCRRCGRVVKLVLPKTKNRKKRKKKKGRTLRGLRTSHPVERRPFLLIQTRVKVHSESKRV